VSGSEWLDELDEVTGTEELLRPRKRQQDTEMDITPMIEPGKANTMAIRVLNDSEVGGLYKRGFIWTAAAE
jgi:hypothetical protein